MSTAELDIGPLTWVKGEIDLALERAAEALDRHGTEGGELVHLRSARNHLHQGHGALSIVGLDGVTHFSEALEQLLADVEDGRLAYDARVAEAAQAAIAAIRHYLDDLVSGLPDQALRLLPAYRALAAARGLPQPAPADLFFPDLSLRPPRREREPAPLAPEALAARLRAARLGFERGLLKWLRNDVRGITEMRNSVAVIEATQATPSARAFWWVALAFLDTIATASRPVNPEFQRLCSRVDAQIRKLIEGSRTVAERLMRDTLYQVAIARASGEHVECVRAAYRLADLVPAATTAADIEPLKPALRACREMLAGAMDDWNRFCAGAAASLPQFHERTKRLANDIQALQQPDLARLLAAVAAVANLLRREPLRHNESMGLEVATGLLLAENALDNFQTLSAEFADQVKVVVDRLTAVARGEPLAAMEVPHLDEMSRKAQERLLMNQVVKEIQANLGAIEQSLDAFFRDPANNGELAGLAKPVRQIDGALTVLGQDRAVEVLHECERAITEFAAPDYQPGPADFEAVASKLSALGFFVEQLKYGPADVDAILNPKPAKPAVVEEEVPPPSVEAELEAAKRMTQTLVGALRVQPEDEILRGEIKQNLEALREDAFLMADDALEQQASAAIAALATEPPAGIEAALSQMAPSGPSAEPSPEVQRLAEASSEEIDAELLGIFIEEAHEVLGAVGELQPQFAAHPHDREILTTIRRSFHTLKGSGRMVGLMELGEAAWAVEQVLNRWLQQEKEATPAVHAMIAQAHGLFVDWVAQLESGGGTHRDATALTSVCEALKSGDQTGMTIPPVPVRPAVVAEAPVVEAVAEAEAEVETAAEPETEPTEEVIELPALESELELEEEAAVIDLPPLELELEEAPAPMPETVAVGDVTLSATLFEMYVAEARSHIAALASGLEVVMPPTPPVIRAAHTLAGISGTAGIFSVSNLAHALENALGRFREATPTEPERLLLARAVGALEGMVGAVAERRLPPQEEMLAAELDALAPAQQFVPPMPDASQEEPSIDLALDFLAEPEAEFSFEPIIAPPLEPIVEIAVEPAEAVSFDLTGEAPLPPAMAEPAAAVEPLPLPEPAIEEPLDLSFAELGPLAELAGPLVEAEASPAVTELELPAAAAMEAAVGDLAVAPPAEVEVAGTPPAAPEAAPALAVPAMTAQALADAAGGERRRSRIQDDLDFQLLPIFLEESQDLMQELGSEIRAWREQPMDGAIANQLKRVLHTFKGSARMAGAMGLGELLHSMESRIEEASTTRAITPSFIEDFETSFDRVSMLIDRLHAIAAGAQPDAEISPEPVAAEPVAEMIAEPVAEPAAEPMPVPSESAAASAPTPAPAVAVAPTPARPEAAEVEAHARSYLRVRADLVDRLVNEAGEMAIARGRIEGEMLTLKTSLLDLTENVIRLRNQLREVEIQAESQMQSRQAMASEHEAQFDPLEFDRFTRFQELTRMMAESVNDVATVQHNLLRNLDHADASLTAQARLNRELSQALMGVRMVPFNTVADRLYRLVRQTAKELGKRANLDIRGGQTELDRSVLEKMIGPIEHLIRNAITHGLEAPASRSAAGKAEIGEIAVKLAQEGNEIVIELADDGAGLDLARIRAKAVERGLLAADAVADEQQLTQLIFLPGFSTAQELTELAGRGVGMDVVRSETAKLGGRVEATSVAGRGTQFRIYLPLTLAVTQAVLVRVGGRRYAIPSSMVQQVSELKPDTIAAIRADGGTTWLGNRYPWRYLNNLLGDAAAKPEPARRHWLLLLRSGTQHVAVEVDDLLGNQEIVVKNIGPQLARVVGIAGATVLGDGEVALILNPIALMGRAAPLVTAAQPAMAAEAAATTVAGTVMVVDDSLTVRKITGRLLAREGYQVMSAKDGVDALEQLLDAVPDVMLVDIEMPRMDGFDLTRNVRKDPRLKDVPIIMITSRTADKHRNFATELGVNHYLGKPYDEDELLGLIAGYTKRAG